MAQLSEGVKRLALSITQIQSQFDLSRVEKIMDPAVILIILPSNRNDADAAASTDFYKTLADWLSQTNKNSTICIASTPPDAARLLPFLDGQIKYQLWIAVKTPSAELDETGRSIPSKHFALLVLTRFKTKLLHAKTRTPYTYCPACGKTTKDYGGKKHVYHEYGTLLSDVWRDISCDLKSDLGALYERLANLFGVAPYKQLRIFDLRECQELLSKGTQNPEISPNIVQIESPKGDFHLESRLINSDCLETLKNIPDNTIDFCFADPPYNLQKEYDRWDDDLQLIRYFEWCDSWLSELIRILKPGRSLAVLNIPLWAIRYYQHLTKSSSFQSWIAWDSLGFPVRLIMPAHYAILVFSKGPSRALPGLANNITQALDRIALSPLPEFYCLRSSCVNQKGRRNKEVEITDLWYDIHRLKHNCRRVDHPTQLPPILMSRLIALYTYPGEMILDCFNGAGTSTLVAQKLGRKYIGIELSPKYHLLAECRHRMLSEGLDPFEKNDIIPKAKNSRVARLKKQKYAVPKKTLQLDVRRIAKELGRLPNREEVHRLSEFPIEYYDEYFISWGEVCAAARTTGMSELPPKIRNLENKQLDLPLKVWACPKVT